MVDRQFNKKLDFRKRVSKKSTSLRNFKMKISLFIFLFSLQMKKDKLFAKK